MLAVSVVLVVQGLSSISLKSHFREDYLLHTSRGIAHITAEEFLFSLVE